MLIKVLRWGCFLTSGCMALAFAAAAYLGTLVPDTLHVVSGGDVRLVSLPLLTQQAGTEQAAPASGLETGSSYNLSIALGGIIPVKTVRAQVVSRRLVNVCGTPFGIKMFADGAMVVGFSDLHTSTGTVNPAKAAGIAMGDVIKSVAGTPTKTNEDVAAALQELEGAPAEVVYTRGTKEYTTLLTAVYDSAAQMWRTGMWVRDSSAGIGTLTFVDEATSMFAGLGHSIHDVDTGLTVSLRSGEIVRVDITGVVKGAQGSPGELQGHFQNAAPAGTILENGESGVYGTVSAALGGFEAEVALPQEIEAGPALMYTTIRGEEAAAYEVEIEKIALAGEDPNRNMIVRVTDERLLSETGGIVQGMSGSPIVQNGRLVGAVTHVLVNDPARGYAIFAENMVEAADAAARKTAA